MKVPSAGKTKKGSGSCLSLVSDSGGVTRCKVDIKTSHLLSNCSLYPGEHGLSFFPPGFLYLGQLLQMIQSSGEGFS